MSNDPYSPQNPANVEGRVRCRRVVSRLGPKCPPLTDDDGFVQLGDPHTPSEFFRQVWDAPITQEERQEDTAKHQRIDWFKKDG